MSNSLRLRGARPPRLLCPGDSPGENPGVGSSFLLQGLLPTQGLNPGLLRLWRGQAASLYYCHLGRPAPSPPHSQHSYRELGPLRLLCSGHCPGQYTGAGYHFLLRGIFPTRDQSRVSCMAGGLSATEPPGRPQTARCIPTNVAFSKAAAGRGWRVQASDFRLIFKNKTNSFEGAFILSSL